VESLWRERRAFEASLSVGVDPFDTAAMYSGSARSGAWASCRGQARDLGDRVSARLAVKGRSTLKPAIGFGEVARFSV
jgi:hypothetical protein